MTTALVIEDNPDNMVLINDLLEASGYRVRQAVSGWAGLDALRAQRPDFVLLDVQLPDIDGYEVLERLREAERREARGAPVPVIAVTSFAMSGDRERLLAAGCNGYIEKPIDPMRVIEQIEQVIGARR